ncbi:SusC/RagA family TonB-linked outer membrane protein [Sinomicrobium oceani]|uniref:SusC/RagA family TonB-linked outer membrane protein n=1 Tax=Sinomicrobium oceani TaxID=1150368 RepID=UPI00227B6CF3|nr:SusC/RagA family TonB-linked outer membrane protein [Sinomicrobium oceani]
MKHATLAGFSCWCPITIALIFLSLPVSLIASPPFQSIAQYQITGIVTDSNGEPLGGVNIVISGKGQGTISDFDGTYTITAASQDSLTFSFIGFKTVKIPVNRQSSIDVQLQEDVTTLNEVTVNAGYYTVSEKERTGSISRITSKDIEKQPVSNPLAAMQGRMSGVDIRQSTGVPGGGFSVQIRGRNSIAAGNDPLYIVDGVPYASESLGDTQTSTIIPGTTSPLNGINPADIESIEILKDADATAIYGSRGANGVVLITTKRGRGGKARLNLHFNSSLGRVSRFMDMMNTGQYLEMRREGFANDGITGFPANAYDVNGAWNPDRYTDWQKELIGSTAYRHSIQASVSGGSATTQYLLSGTYQKETDVFPGDGRYIKGAVSTRVNHKSADDRFALDFSINYVVDDNNLPSTDLTRQALTLAPNAPELYDEEGNLNWENGTWTNPLSYLESEYFSQSFNLVANTVISYQIFSGLQFKTSLGYTDTRLDDKRTNPSTRYNPALGYDSSRSSIYVNNGTRHSWIIEPQLHWEQTIGQHGKLQALVGATFQKQNSKQKTEFAQGFPSNRLIHDLSAASIHRIRQNTSMVYKYQAFFGRINLNWKQKYILNLTGRRDGSSRFGPGNHFANFGAIGLAWIFSEEKGIKDKFSFLSFGKLRASYGTTGNDQIGDYQFLDTYTVTGNSYENLIGLQPSRLFNPNFGWETNRKLEAALEIGLWEDRIFFTAGYYRNRSSSQLVGIPLPGTTGFPSIQANLNATVQNTGMELELRSINVKSNHLNWTTSWNLTIPRNKLIEFPGLEGSTFSNAYVVGKSLSIQKLYHYTGIDAETGTYTFEDYNQDGELTTLEDRQWIEDMAPKVFGGVGNNITYKNWALEFFFQYYQQNRLRSFFGTPGAMLNQPKDILNHWRESADTAPYQKYTGGTNLDVIRAYSRYVESDGNITNTHMIRLKTISLTYTLPESITGKIKCMLYLQGQNLLTITNFKGQDPEQTSGYLPPLRQLTAGLQLSF